MPPRPPPFIAYESAGPIDEKLLKTCSIPAMSPAASGDPCCLVSRSIIAFQVSSYSAWLDSTAP